ncbi:hypothetical protein AC629_12860 [Bradyrhizobium sp. NAS80.1]|uniref:hypothetical protein n=1 Tax=Bradyrhizobium sp. NAS80.1 TaxID=1680159 RepID=UPI000961F8BC|nr:hypothetical protein [Bradyrhizobium sp. NAS80.1]OKO87708.1 hypothetical protein AC629_12860 [Bradyrhizobium sp. NAS80.1]
MKTFLMIVGMWLLINVLFVVVMTPPRKAGKSNLAGLASAPANQNSDHFADEDKVSIRHTIIAVALSAFFSLTPPLIEAAESIRQMIKKRRKDA